METLAILMSYAMLIAFVGILRALEPRAPRAAPILTALALVGFSSLIVLRTADIFLARPEVDTGVDSPPAGHEVSTLAAMPWVLLAPLTLVLTGIFLWRARVFAQWSAALVVSPAP